MSVVHDVAHRRFNYVEEEFPAFIDYRKTEGGLDLYHTEVDPRMGGRGIGGKLVRGTLDLLREEGLKIKPTCSFVEKFIEKNPEYADLLL